jgi:hypothetical protein
MRKFIAAALIAAFALTGSLASAEIGGPAVIGQAMAQPNQQPGGPPVVLVAPAQSATIDTGSAIGQLLEGLIAAFGSVLAALLSAWIYKLFQKAGVELNQAQRDKLQEIAENALHISAHEVTTAIAGRGQIKNKILGDAVRYVQMHGADTIKALGLDPTSPVAIDAIKARMLAAINDPATPTPKVLDDAAPPTQPLPTMVPAA